MNARDTVKSRKKLIEVSLPLEAINTASALEKGNPFLKGHPRNIHQWWSRKPLATARAIIFAQMVDDPSSRPELFPSEDAQEKERQRLFCLIEELVQWENATNEDVLERARAEIRKSWRMACADNADHPRAKELFDPEKLPAFHDPFAGGGSLPLEAQRLGLESYASDLNPVAVLINKAMIEIPPRFAGMPPVNPQSHADKTLVTKTWRGAQGLAEDVRYYGKWMRDEAEKRIGHLYPKVEITEEMTRERLDLKPLRGRKLTVIAWLWARTVKSPNPAFADVDVPLASTFMLSTKPGKETYLEPLIEEHSYRFTVKIGKPKDMESTKNGTKLARGASFRCVMSGTAIAGDYIKAEGKAGRIDARLMAVVADGDHGRVYLPPTEEMEITARQARPTWLPDGNLVEDARAFTPYLYGFTQWARLFTPRQLVALTTFSDLIQEVQRQVERDFLKASTIDNIDHSEAPEFDAYTNAISIFASFAIDKLADYNNVLCTWNPINQNIGHLFTKQTISMVWGFPETSPLDGGLSFDSIIDGIARTIELLPAKMAGKAFQENCSMLTSQQGNLVISTDPPYYDNIGYADLSDFFYVWLRHSLKDVFPDLFSTVSTPKDEELVATPYRHGGKEQAEAFFLSNMTQAMQCLAKHAHTNFPLTIYYAFKQSESNAQETVSTGWETFLDALIRTGFVISGTWPIRTERESRTRGQGSNALASSILLVCHPRAIDAPTTTTRREFLTALTSELPTALAHLQRSNIAPVDLAQAAIGPGMAIYTRYAKVLDAEGKELPVREALALINKTLDKVFAEQEDDFDADSRWALAWFEQYGFIEGEFGVAETLSKAKDTSIGRLADDGILASKGGKVRLLQPTELSVHWNPVGDSNLTVWETTHHIIRVLEENGEGEAAKLVTKLGGKADIARELAYRLYTICERKKRAKEALSYNGLVQSWPEIARLSRESATPKPVQQTLIEG